MRQPLPQRPAVRGAPSRGGGGMGTGVVARLAGGAAERGDAAPRVIAVRVAAYDDESLGYVRLCRGEDASPDGSHTGDGPSSGDDGSSGARDGSSAGDDVFDVELLFWDDDEVVNVQVAARDATENRSMVVIVRGRAQVHEERGAGSRRRASHRARVGGAPRHLRVRSQVQQLQKAVVREGARLRRLRRLRHGFTPRRERREPSMTDQGRAGGGGKDRWRRSVRRSARPRRYPTARSSISSRDVIEH